MKENKDIIQAYNVAISRHKKAALATVVKVDGSSYRRPGARMLVDEDGQLTGAISGGCLEGDALRKALQAIHEGKNKLVVYDTTDEDDAKFGVQLGCNGIVYILFEPLSPGEINNPIHLLQQITSIRQDAVLVTAFCLDRSALQPGTILCVRHGTKVHGAAWSSFPARQIEDDAAEALRLKTSLIKSFDNQVNALFQYIAPAIHLVVAGAGNDAMPVVAIARGLGWDVTVADGRPAQLSEQRFHGAKLLLAKPDDVPVQIQMDAQTVFVLMTHNYNYDLALLKKLAVQDCVYIGMLGPKKKLDRMLGEMNEEGIVLNAQQLSVIYGPVGLDIGAETAEEIAIAVVAEIKAVLAGRSGSSLKEKTHPIHSNPVAISQSNV